MLILIWYSLGFIWWHTNNISYQVKSKVTYQTTNQFQAYRIFRHWTA